MRPEARHFFLLAVLLVGGCATGPDYVRPGVDMPEGWRVSAEEAAGIANVTWWREFEDPVLDELIETALANNKDMRIAAARVEEFAARVGITRADALPAIGYGADASRSRLPGGGSRDLYSATLNLGWELDVWGRIRRATEAARAELLAAEEGRRTVILSLVTAVATSYVQLRNLDRQLEIARDTLSSRAESVRLFEIKLRGGVISELELAQVRSEYEQAAVRVPALERLIALQENALSVLLGRNPGPVTRGRRVEELRLPAIPPGIPSDVLMQRPDVRAAEQRLIAANARIGVARAAWFPSISLTGVLGQSSGDLGNLFSSSSTVWNVGGGALGPIFEGGRIKGGIRVSEAQQRQALQEWLRAIQTAFREINDALISVEKRREELDAQARQVDALRMYSRKARTRYQEGYVSYIEVLDAERRLFDAELQYEQARAELFAALINVYKALGGGWIEEADRMLGARAVEDGAGLSSSPGPGRPALSSSGDAP